MGQRSIDQVREHGLDDRVLAVGDVRVGDRFGVVGEERVIPPHREQLVGVVAVADPPHDQPGSDLIRCAGERGVGDFGDLGVGDPLTGVGVGHGTGVTHRDPRILADGADRAEYRSGLGQHEGEPGASVQHRSDDLAVAERGITPAHDGARAEGFHGVDGFGDHARRGVSGGHRPPVSTPGNTSSARSARFTPVLLPAA